MKIYIFILFALLIFSGCQRDPLYIRLADKMAARYSVKMQQKYGVNRSGYGGSMMEDIESFNFTLTSYKRMQVDEARILYISLVEEFLQEVNADESVRPYLHNYPFTRSNVRMILSFEDPKTFRRFEQPDLTLVIKGGGTITYCAWDYSKNNFVDMHEEPYAEAYEKVYGKPYEPPQEM